MAYGISEKFSPEFSKIASDNGFDMFNIQGQSVFPVYGPSGGLTTNFVSYLFSKDGYYVPFYVDEDHLISHVRLQKAIHDFDKLKKKVPRDYDLGLPSE